ncbi:MAG: selenium-dependent molybdenum cofactor biosynthesis protein YqeB [Eubacteriales bacterium]|nr:selenium-dependent molybdenum cofactor biosynthesis protein YqeB [Eubacteriales bacterium]
MNNDIFIICRGGGDLATGIVHRLARCGFRTLVLETDRPAAIRRQVSFCEAVYDGETVIEGVKAKLISFPEAEPEEVKAENAAAGTKSAAGTESVVAAKLRRIIDETICSHAVPLLVDPEGKSIELLRPDIVIDAIIAKKNLGTRLDMAPLVVGVGPGFTCGVDVDYIVETKRGHNLARIITEGSAFPNTGVPGNIGGYTSERVIHSDCAGIVKNICKIGDVVEAGQEIARIYTGAGASSFTGDYVPVRATIPGIIRGLIREGYAVTPHFKMADIDPRREELKNCFTISDKSRSIGGSALELVTAFANHELPLRTKKSGAAEN